MLFTLIKSPTSVKNAFLLVPSVECWSFTVWNNEGAESDTLRLFSLSLLEVSIFSTHTENLILRGGPVSGIYDITNSKTANMHVCMHIHRK